MNATRVPSCSSSDVEGMDIIPRCGLPITEYHDSGVQAGHLRKALTVSTIASIKAVKIAPETLLLKRTARRATADTVPVDKAVITFIS